MVLYDLVKSDVVILDENTTLLKSNNMFIKIDEDESNHHMAYLYYDHNAEKWIRSGKVAGRSFAKRHKEHERKAKEKYPTSKFYRERF